MRHEAEMSLAKILELACKPLTESSIHGRPVTTSTLMARDARHLGVTFTAKMQPAVVEGQSIDLFFRCRLPYMFVGVSANLHLPAFLVDQKLFPRLF